MAAGECQTKNVGSYDEEDEKDEKPTKALDEGDIAILRTYGIGPYSNALKNCEEDIKKSQERVNELIGIKESDTGLSLPSQWDLVSDKQMMQEEQPLQVVAGAHCIRDPVFLDAVELVDILTRATTRVSLVSVH